MDTKKLMDVLGGRKAVIEITELTRGRISQWVVENEVPTPWLKFFKAKFPRVDWASYQPKSALAKPPPPKKSKRAPAITTP
jgi:hypothetical protein